MAIVQHVGVAPGALRIVLGAPDRVACPLLDRGAADFGRPRREVGGGALQRGGRSYAGGALRAVRRGLVREGTLIAGVRRDLGGGPPALGVLLNNESDSTRCQVVVTV